MRKAGQNPQNPPKFQAIEKQFFHVTFSKDFPREPMQVEETTVLLILKLWGTMKRLLVSVLMLPVSEHVILFSNSPRPGRLYFTLQLSRFNKVELV